MNIGIIGFGVMGKNHYRVLKDIASARVAAVCDPIMPQGLTEPVFENVDEMLGKIQLDAAVIAVPTFLHKEVAVKCIEKGIHLLIEKPAASTVADGEKIAELSRKNNTKVVVGHIERFNPVVQQLKKEIVRHEVFTISITRIGPIPPRIADVGVLTDLSVHDIDLIRFLTAREIAKTNIFHSKKSTEDHEDNAVLTFELEGSIIASIVTNWLTPFKRRKIEVATRTAYYEADLMSQELWEYSSFKKDNSYVARPCFVRKSEPLRNELAAFLEMLGGETAGTFATVEDSLATLRVIG